jgi:hypothetical protein
VAVGHVTTRTGAGAALAEHWNGTRWSIAALARPPAAATTLLFDVSCASRSVCVAVGSATNRAGATVPLAERWNGSTWMVERSVVPRAFHGAISYLGGVSCLTATSCTAVGYVGNSTGTRGAALTERWDGTRWRLDQTPRVGGAIAAFLSGVSCSTPRSCTAVGFANRAGGVSVPFAEGWNGSRWGVQRVPAPAAATSVRLAGVSCGSTRSCTAVGSFTIVTGIEIMLAEHWNGERWTVERARYPVGARNVQLSGVSCPSMSFCTAVGSFNNVAGIDVTLAETRRGAGWAVVRPPNPPHATAASFGSVSCSARAICMAVGSSAGPDGIETALAERSSSTG